MVSCLSTAVGIIILISVYLKKKEYYLSSMIITYMILVYSYLQQICFGLTFGLHSSCFTGMLTYLKKLTTSTEDLNTTVGLSFNADSNFLLPLLVLVSSSIKRNYKVVSTMAVVVICGHWLDYFNIVMPGTVGPFWNIGFTGNRSNFIHYRFIYLRRNVCSF